PAMSLVILLAATLGGAALTWLFDEDAPLPARLAMGAPLGVTLLGLVGFVLASYFGLTVATVAVATCLVASPLALLVLHAPVKARAASDLRRFLDDVRGLRRPSMAWVLLPLLVAATLLVVRLYDRAFFVAPDGGIHTGLDHTLGDLPYHLAIISSFVEGQNYPPEHPELAGARLTYPFLVDFVTAQLVAAGSSLRDAFFEESVLLALALLATLHRFARLLSRSTAVGVLAVALVVASGGFGWWRLFSEVEPSAGGLVGHLQHLSHDYTILYTGELRWGNVFICMLIPQRSLLLGMPLFLVVAAQWWRILAEDDTSRRRVMGAGAIAGLLPLAHAHSFVLALALGGALFVLFRRLRDGLVFLGTALIVAAPQVTWLAVGTSMKAAGFVAVQPWWDHGEQDPLRFWLWNLGLFLPLSLLALVWRGKRPLVERRLLLFYAPFALCFVVPNVLRLSPWMWDNIKFLVYWHLAAAVLVALLLVRLWEGRGVRRVLAAGLFLVLTLSGAIDLWRVASHGVDHTLFEPAAVAFARRIAALTPPRAIVLHATTFKSEVYLTGRRSVLGYPGHMWSQGLDSGARESDIKAIYAGEPGAWELLERYRVRYVLMGPREREGGAREDAFADLPVVAEAGDRVLYGLPNR
ncbi:MAG: hypothetical protein ACREBE_06185, partial [bacterium]